MGSYCADNILELGIMCLSENSYFYELYGKEEREQGRMEIIQNLLESGLSAEQVSKLAKVPLNRVQSIKF